jgi:hypothetical protein
MIEGRVILEHEFLSLALCMSQRYVRQTSLCEENHHNDPPPPPPSPPFSSEGSWKTERILLIRSPS